MPLAGDTPALALLWLVLSAWAVCALALVSNWARSWVTAGCAFESLLFSFGPALQTVVPPWSLVLCLNGIYAVASTSWLFRIIFTAVCWPLVLVTCIAKYAAVSSFTRGRLRRVLKHMHFYRDKVAFFGIPVLVIDEEVTGFVAVHGVTVSLLTFTIDFHSIDVSVNLGEGHEIQIHTDSVQIKLFRGISIGEIFAAHKCVEDGKAPSLNDILSADTHRSSCDLNEAPMVEDNIAHESKVQQQQGDSAGKKASRSTSTSSFTHPDDAKAEARYDDTLREIRSAGGLYQTRKRLTEALCSDQYTDSKLIEIRAALCTELRRAGLSPPRGARRITTSKLATFFPEPNVFEYVPSAMRALLWLASLTHPIDCPSISVAGSGNWLNDLICKVLFRRHSTDDARIRNLESEISEWLSVGEYCADLSKITAQAFVPLREVYNIKAEIRSTNFAVSRIDTANETSTQMASLSGVDGAFIIPTCLLPNHSHLVPPEPSAEEVAELEKKRHERTKNSSNSDDKLPSKSNESLDESAKEHLDEKRDPTNDEDNDDEAKEIDHDTLGVSMSVRVTLPARFDESFLSFATTLSKAGQMLDIEETIVDPPTPPPLDETDDQAESLREKIADKSNRLGSAMKHPWQSARGAFNREVRKTTVMKVNGAWFAKWTNKALEQLEWLNGDVGYSFEIPVSLKPYR